jgi:hypothetical protein
VRPDAIYEDEASGRRDDRPGLAVCLKALREGDTLVVWKHDRLGSDLHHLVNTVHDLSARSVELRVLTGHGAAIDTTTPTGKLVFGFFAALAKFERELIVERTKAGLGSCPGPGLLRRADLQDDPCEAAVRSSFDGPARNQGWRTMRRARSQPPDAITPRCSGRLGTAGRAKGFFKEGTHEHPAA